MKKNYCGIVFLGGGSSWAWGEDIKETAKAAAKKARKDWRHFFNIPENGITVRVFDMTDHDGWYADCSGVFNDKTDELIKVHEVIKGQ